MQRWDVTFYLVGGGTLMAPAVDSSIDDIKCCLKEDGYMRITSPSGQVTLIYEAGVAAVVMSKAKPDISPE